MTTTWELTNNMSNMTRKDQLECERQYEQDKMQINQVGLSREYQSSSHCMFHLNKNCNCGGCRGLKQRMGVNE